MKYLFFVTLAFFFASLAHAQEATQLKRTPYRLAVAVDKKTVYEEDLKEGPFVYPDNTVQLYPGETVFIEVELEGDAIKTMTAVQENINPSKTLVLTFTQTAKKKVHESMMLKVENPFKQTLVYQANIFILNHDKWVKTDVFPVRGGLSGYETWQDIITSIGLGKWTFKS